MPYNNIDSIPYPFTEIKNIEIIKIYLTALLHCKNHDVQQLYSDQFFQDLIFSPFLH